MDKAKRASAKKKKWEKNIAENTRQKKLKKGKITRKH